MRKVISVASPLSLALALVGPAAAGKVGFLKTWVYDPTGTGQVSSEWTKEGLVLTKDVATSVWASAGADIKGVEGEQLTSLSFEFKNGTHAGAGAPRFSVSYEGEAGYHFFSALYGTQKPAGAGWTKVEPSATTPYCDGVTATDRSFRHHAG